MERQLHSAEIIMPPRVMYSTRAGKSVTSGRISIDIKGWTVREVRFALPDTSNGEVVASREVDSSRRSPQISALIFVLRDIESHMFSPKLACLVFCVAALLSDRACIACQSGSRGPAAAGSVATPTPALAPTQTFSAPLNSTPLNTPSQSFSTPSVLQPQTFQGTQLSQPVYADPSFSNGQFIPQNGTTGFSSQPGATSPQPASASGSGSTVAGIPSSSLVDPIFQTSDPSSAYAVDHSAWNCFLSRYLITDRSGINRVRYGQVSRSDRCGLKNYLQQLQSVDTRTLNRNEQLAFWFNLYNARTVDIVLDNYPIRSIRQVKQKFTDFVGPFDDPGAVNVLGKSLSLNDIESGIVRPVWNDPRIHYALNCASYGCPNLSPTAWNAYDLEQRLDSAAYAYINSNRAVKRGVSGVRVAKIYKWYKDDFGGTDQAVLNHIRQYANGNTLNKLRRQSSIRGYFYDWSLNDARIQRRRLLEPLIR